MALGSSKAGLLGAGITPAGSQTFNTSGTFVATGLRTVSVTGKGGPGNAGSPGNAGNPGRGGVTGELVVLPKELMMGIASNIKDRVVMVVQAQDLIVLLVPQVPLEIPGQVQAGYLKPFPEETGVLVVTLVREEIQVMPVSEAALMVVSGEHFLPFLVAGQGALRVEVPEIREAQVLDEVAGEQVLIATVKVHRQLQIAAHRACMVVRVVADKEVLLILVIAAIAETETQLL